MLPTVYNLFMTDWKLAASARCPEIPEPELERIVPVLEALEAAFARAVERIPVEAEAAATFSAETGEQA